MHGPAEMPDLRLWLAEQWLPGKPFHYAAAPYHASRAHRALLAAGRTATRPDQVEGYANHERTVLNHATLWWVAESNDHEARQWTHRWLVHGHWRWQPHGPGRTLRRLTYIRPHVKGPDDLPLRVPTRVNSWVR